MLVAQNKSLKGEMGAISLANCKKIVQIKKLLM